VAFVNGSALTGTSVPVDEGMVVVEDVVLVEVVVEVVEVVEVVDVVEVDVGPDTVNELGE